MLFPFFAKTTNPASSDKSPELLKFCLQNHNTKSIG